MMGDIRTLDHGVNFLEAGTGGMKTSQIVEQQALQLVFSARGVQVDEGADAGGVL